MSNRYRSGKTLVAGITGAVVFFVTLFITSKRIDAYALMTGRPTMIGDSFDYTRELPPLTVAGQIGTLLAWIGPPIVLSILAMWLVLLIRDKLGRNGE